LAGPVKCKSYRLPLKIRKRPRSALRDPREALLEGEKSRPTPKLAF
jgi:hypothetical protein